MDKRRKIGKAKERKEKEKRGKDEEVNGQGGKRGAPAPHGATDAQKTGKHTQTKRQFILKELSFLRKTSGHC